MQIKAIALGSTAWQRFINRWGVSFLIGEDILFDTFGKPKVFLQNLKKFKVNPTNIKHIIISHSHWDHISGLWNFIANFQDLTVYVCSKFEQKIKERIVSFGVKLIEVKEVFQIKENVYSTGKLYAKFGNEEIYEQSVIIDKEYGLTVICGCAHPDVVNIIRYVKEYFKKDIFYLIGGFHLKDNLDQTNFKIIEQLKQLGVCKIAPTHCTGKNATKQIKKFSALTLVRLKKEM